LALKITNREVDGASVVVLDGRVALGAFKVSGGSTSVSMDGVTAVASSSNCQPAA